MGFSSLHFYSWFFLLYCLLFNNFYFVFPPLLLCSCVFSQEHKVLLTGTPLQNTVEELFSLLHFLEPAQFPSETEFLKDFGDLKTEEQVKNILHMFFALCNVLFCSSPNESYFLLFFHGSTGSEATGHLEAHDATKAQRGR